MKRLLVFSLLFYSLVAFGQMPRKWDSRDSIIAEYHNSTLQPVFAEEPLFEVSKEIRGWVYTKDRQWLTEPNKIPLLGISTDKELYGSDWAELGLDNMERMAIHLMTVGEDTFYVYTKVYTTGEYKSPLTERGWNTSRNLYYAVIRKPSSSPELTSLKVDSNYYFGFTIYDEGIIEQKGLGLGGWKSIIKDIESSLYLERNVRKLVFQVERKQHGQLRFLVYSIHPVFDDPWGLVQDYKVLNKSIYGVKETLYRAHYTLLESEWPATILP